jgi:uncharacterized protein YkwD
MANSSKTISPAKYRYIANPVPPKSSIYGKLSRPPGSSSLAAGTAITLQTKEMGLSAIDIQGILDVHNHFRANHKAQNLVWSNSLAQLALSW